MFWGIIEKRLRKNEMERKMDDKKLKKVIDKFFCQVYYPTRKGKDVFEIKFSETSFTFKT